MSTIPSMILCDIIKQSDQKHRNKVNMIESYPIIVQYAPNYGCYIAYLPDFGLLECSATGKTRRKALKNLDTVRQRVITSYSRKGQKLPMPSQNPLDKLMTDILKNGGNNVHR